MRNPVLVPVALSTAALLAAAPARPCSLAFGLSGVSAPAADAVGVPTNAELVLDSSGGEFPVTATIQQGDGAPVNLDVSFDGNLVIVGLGELLPSTTYTVAATAEANFSELEPITFTTGTADDTSAPSFDGEATATVEHESPDLFGAESSCGPGSANNLITIAVPPVNDDVGVAAFRLFRLLDNGTRQLRRGVLAEFAGDRIFDFEPEPGQYRYAVVAVDFAGNESEPAEVLVDVSGFGCSATSRTSSPGLAALFGLLGLALGARRAHRGHNSRRASRPAVVE